MHALLHINHAISLAVISGTTSCIWMIFDSSVTCPFLIILLCSYRCPAVYVASLVVCAVLQFSGRLQEPAVTRDGQENMIASVEWHFNIVASWIVILFDSLREWLAYPLVNKLGNPPFFLLWDAYDIKECLLFPSHSLLSLTPVFSTPIIWCHVFHSRVFHPCIFDCATFSTPAFSVAPVLHHFLC